jgi:chromosomal replication initiation ATPase DnaA
MKTNNSILPRKAEFFVEDVLNYYRITKEQLISSRKRPYPQIKQMIAYFLHKEFKCSYVSIGGYFNQDHATMIHSVKQSESLISFPEDPYYYIYEDVLTIYNRRLSPQVLGVMFEIDYRRYLRKEVVDATV